MTCDSYHSTPQDPDCPFCVIIALVKALDRLAPEDPALTPAFRLLNKAQLERAAARRAATVPPQGAGPAANAVPVATAARGRADARPGSEW